MALSRRIVAEALGTAFLLAAVVGSGIMGEKLAGGNTAIALLANTLATGAILTTLIFIFGPISGGHFNPAVTLADAFPVAVGLYITSAYWFTASTSFANPAVTIAREFTNTFAGIRPIDAPGFVVAQLLGALAATVLFRWLVPSLPSEGKDLVLPQAHVGRE